MHRSLSRVSKFWMPREEIGEDEILRIDAGLVLLLTAGHLIVVMAVADEGIHVAVGELDTTQRPWTSRTKS